MKKIWLCRVYYEEGFTTKDYRGRAATNRKKKIHHRDAEYAEFGDFLIKNS